MQPDHYFSHHIEYVKSFFIFLAYFQRYKHIDLSLHHDHDFGYTSSLGLVRTLIITLIGTDIETLQGHTWRYWPCWKFSIPIFE